MSEHSAVPAAEAAARALRDVAEMTGRTSEGVTAIQPAADGWRVCIEVVEIRRIPDTADVMAVYEADIDSAGNLTGYRRTARYYRGRAEGS